MDEQSGTSESQVLRQEGRTSGQGASDGTSAADETEPGRTDVGTSADEVPVTVVSGERDVATDAGVVADGAGVKVVGGASVHFVQTVAVDVMTISETVTEVVVIVLEPEVLVSVIGHSVVVV